MKEDFKIIIADVPNREEPVCEIYYKEMGWIELSYENSGKFIVVFFNKKGSSYWEFPYDEAMEVLQEAKNRLSKYQRTPEQQATYKAKMEELESWNPTPEEIADYEQKMEEQRKRYYG